MSIEKLRDLMHETQAYEIFGHLLVDRELREARQRGEIEWFDLRKGPHYTEQQIMDYLKLRMVRRCETRPLDETFGKPPVSGNSRTSGSDERRVVSISRATGMNQAQDEYVARALEQQT